MDDRLTALAQGFDTQAGWCHALGSPFSGALMHQAAEALRAGDDVVGAYMPWWDGVTSADVVADMAAAAVALRFLGCAHALALAGRAPALAARYPSCGGDGTPEGVWALALEAFAAAADFTADFVTRPPQTNEVARAGALMPGLLELARLTDMPLSLFEIGASAGLLQGLDRFQYRFGDVVWGDAASPCRITPTWRGPDVPPVAAPFVITARRACDYAPVDVLNPNNALKIRSFIWADMAERLARTDAAIAIAQEVKPQVDGMSADQWLADVLREPAVPGVARCVFHSVMWQYMPQDVQARAYAAIARAGAQATAQTPLAWLRLEPVANGTPMQVVLAVWQGGACDTRRLAAAHPHALELSWHNWENAERLASPELVQQFG